MTFWGRVITGFTKCGNQIVIPGPGTSHHTEPHTEPHGTRHMLWCYPFCSTHDRSSMKEADSSLDVERYILIISNVSDDTLVI